MKRWTLEYRGDMAGCVRPGQNNGRSFMTRPQQVFRRAVREAWLAEHGTTTPDGPLRVEITYFRPRPKTRAKKAAEPGWLVMKPDADNLAKPILDALFLLPAKRRRTAPDGSAMKPGKRWDDGLPDGIAIDDSSVASLTIHKIEANDIEPGFFLSVELLAPPTITGRLWEIVTNALSRLR